MKNQAKNKTAPLTTAPLKCATVTNAPVIIAPIRIAALFLLLLTSLLFLVGCKTKHTITEKTITKTDSIAIWNLNDSLSKMETLIANLQIDLQSLRDENIRLMNETSTHKISYDTSAPVNPETGKPPIASESFIVSKSTLEQTIKNYETLLQTVSLENEILTQQNHNLRISIEKLTNENIVKKSKFSQSDRLNLLFYFIGIVIGLFLMKLLACRSKNIKHY